MLRLFKKKKFLVPVDSCFNAILDAIKREGIFSHGDVWSWLEAQGVKRKWNWKTHKNYLVFDNEQAYTMFLMRL